MAKIKYTVTTTIIDNVPAGGKPLKLKDVKSAIRVSLSGVVGDAAPVQLSLGKVKIAPAE